MPLSAGTRLGRYEIIASIGAGGMGEVYSARDTLLERRVAVKILPERLAQEPGALPRFEREFKAVASLSHANILALHDFGSEGSISFAVTELLEGETLREHLKKGALPWRSAIDLAASVADGLAHAHSKGVVHRDLKPENIFLVSSGGGVKILDFGLARVTAPADGAPQDPSQIQTETGAGLVMGTPAYMSPEQVRGQTAGPPSDLFSFGCVLYEMLQGRRAFQRETSVQTMTAILETEPPPLAGSGKDIPAGLERVVAQCLQKNPGQRFQSAHDLAFALKAVSAGGSIGMLPARRRRWLPVAVVSALALLLAAAAFYWKNSTIRPIDSLAVLPFVNVGADTNQEYLSDGITEHLINSLSGLPALRVTARSLAFRYKGAQVDPQKAGRDLHVRAVLTGRVTERGGSLNIQAELVNVDDGAQLWGAQYSRNFSEILALQREIIQAISAALHRQTALSRPEAPQPPEPPQPRRDTDNTEAYQAYLKGRYYWNRRNEQSLKRAVQYFQQAIDKDPGYALAWAGLADCYAIYNSYQVELPRESGPKAKAAATRALEIDDSLAEAHASLGMIRMSYEWDWPGAAREFERAIQLDPNYATAHHWYAVCLAATGRSESAIASLQRAHELDPLSLIVSADTGMALAFARRNDEAVEQLRKVLEMDPNFVTGHRHLGMALEQKALYPEAIAEFQKALELSQGNPFVLGYLGHAYAASGNGSKARQTLGQLADLSKQRYVPALHTAVIYAGLGDKDRAMEWLEKGFAERSLDMIFLKVDPRFDQMRTDSRFAALLRRMGLG